MQAMQGLANPNNKIRRAKIHLDSLESEIRKFTDTKPYRIFTRDDPQADHYVVEYEFDTPEIWPIGPILGDFINCLRASLDHLVYGLVNLHGGIATKDHTFPIIAKFASADTPRRIFQCTAGMPADAVTIIESLQPYNAKLPEESFLYKLHTLWNIDKHRYIPLHSGGLQLDFSLPVIGHTIETVNDRRVARFPLALKPQVNLEPHTVHTIVNFGSDADGVNVDAAYLSEMHDFIGNSVIPRFLRFYK